MAATANELLGGILVTLKSIDNKTEKAAPTRGNKIAISGAIASLSKIKRDDRKNFVGFVGDIAKIAQDTDPKNMKAMTDGLVSFSAAIPSVAEGLDELGRIKEKRVTRAINVIERLFNFFEDVGDNRSQGNIKRAVATFDSMGTSLKKIADPLNSMSFFLLKLGISIVGFAAALLLTSVMLGASSPWAGIAMVVGVVVGMVGLMWLLGAAGKTVDDGGKTVKTMGFALMALAAGMVLFIGALLVIPMMLGESADYMGMLKAAGLIGLIVGGTALLFAGIGLFDKHIKKGVLVAGWVALGLVALAGSVIIIALAARAIAGIASFGEGADENKKMSLFGFEVPPFVYGLGVMGSVILGGLALFAILGIPAVAGLVATGVAVSVAAAVGMIALAWSVKELSNIAMELSGQDVAANIESLISGTFIGFTNGIMIGLLGKKPSGTMDAIKAAALIPARTAALIGGIGLLSGVSIALSLFALSLRAFQKVGQITPITGHDAEGKPIYGKGVTVAAVARNIAESIGIFFQTLGEVFGPGGSALPSKEVMDTILYALMGKGGFSMFGVPIANTGPNLMDALYNFGEVLQFWGKFGEEGRISIGNDKDGKPLKGPKVTSVAENIASALGAFMRGLSSEIIDLDDNLAEKSTQVAYILLGKKQTGLLGWAGKLLGVTRDRPGILEPVAKFGEIISQFASGQYISGYNEDGTPIYKKIDYKKTALNIVDAIQTFTKSLADGLTKADASGVNYGKSATKAAEFLEDFEDMFTGLQALSEAQTGIDRLADSMNNLGVGIGLVAENVGALDADKLDRVASTAASYEESTGGSGSNNEARRSSSGRVGGRSQDNPDWAKISDMIGAQVGQQVTAALTSGHLKFEFSSPTGGVLMIEQD